jgi:hypothetical protein
MTLGTEHKLGKANEYAFPTTVGEKCTIGAGSVPTALAAYVTAVEYGNGIFHRTVFTLTALPIATVDNGTAGHAGTTKIYDFPKGYIRISGGVHKYTLLTVDGTGLTNAAAISLGVGSTAAGTDMVSLTGTAQNIVTADAITFSTATTGTNQTQGNVTVAGLDGSSTAADAILNVACSAATAASDGVLTLTGTIIVDWSNLCYAGE